VRGAIAAAFVLTAALAGCGVKAPPRPPVRAGAEPRERPPLFPAPLPGSGALAPAAIEGDCGCAPPEPCPVTTTTKAP
jgi:hypothetical protein